MISISKNEPFVLLLDLDNTIQGGIEPQLEEYSLLQHLNAMPFSTLKLKQNKDYLDKDLASGLLRPGFKKFVKRMKDRFPNVEFFVYTASEDEWGKYMVRHIERHIGVPFNSKVFTRSDCIREAIDQPFSKSIAKVTPDIFTALKKKYDLPGKKTTYQFKHIYLIDNNRVLRGSEEARLIQCPHYTRKAIINPLRSIPYGVVKANFKTIGKYLLNNEYSNVFRFYAELYAVLEKKYIKEKILHSTTSDDYWMKQLKLFKRTYQLL